ncbi:MAG TPA: CmpA/NrtA family ABC transporter substrate-binding protein [Fibrobacteria bacterium]|nr:CmpA/NrtA family ABC transporter substrate-binding protein [Fibrobacteria bacterium]
MTSPIHIGFVALTDCAPLVVAREAGFFQEQGLEVELERQISWEHAERRLIDGTLQASHVLATLPLRATLALSETPAPLCTAWVLCRGGNAITASNSFWKKCQGGLAGMIQGGEVSLPLRLGVIHRFSPHEYHLREWLRQQALDPDQVAQWIVVPPQEMVGRLRDGLMEAFCAGEPWNQRATSSKLGAVAALGADLLPDRAEKALAVRLQWHRQHREEHAALLRALDRAGKFLSAEENLPQVADWLSSNLYVNSVRDLLLSDLRGDLDAGFRRRVGNPRFLRFWGDHTNVPRLRDAQAWVSTFAEWGHCHPSLLEADLSEIYLEEFHREVVG